MSVSRTHFPLRNKEQSKQRAARYSRELVELVYGIIRQVCVSLHFLSVYKKDLLFWRVSSKVLYITVFWSSMGDHLKN